MKVEIDFPVDFDSRGVLPIPFGRLYLGPHVVRLALFPDGQLRMHVSSEAVKSGHLQLQEPPPESELTGFDFTKR